LFLGLIVESRTKPASLPDDAVDKEVLAAEFVVPNGEAPPHECTESMEGKVFPKQFPFVQSLFFYMTELCSSKTSKTLTHKF
jgi:hypothetical protein